MVNNMKKQFSVYPLLTVLAIIFLCVGVALRIYKVSSIPAILNRDEAALAYNAKLIIENGTDEWGNSLPIQFRSFGDYKLPGYVYMLSGLFLIFGQNDFVVRLPSIFAGIAIIFLVSLLTSRIVGKFSSKKSLFCVSLFAAAATPFLIFYSRMAWEANLALALLLAAIAFLFQKPLSWKKSIVGIFFYILAICTYNTPLLLFPIIFISWLFFHWPLQKQKLMVLGILSTMFLTGLLLFQSTSVQKSAVTLFGNETIQSQYPAYRQSFSGMSQQVFGNRYVYWMGLMGRRYIQTWSPQFLVFEGGEHPWHTVPGFGHVYLIQWLFFLIGIIFIIRQLFLKIKKGQNFSEQDRWKVVMVWFSFAGSLPAIITVDAPHATRSLFFLITIVIVSSYACWLVIHWVVQRSKQLAIILGIVILGVFLSESIRYINGYFRNWAQAYPIELMVGLPKTITALENNPSQRIAVIDPEGYSYIVVAWYQRISAKDFFTTIYRHDPDQSGLSYGFRVGQFQFYKQSQDTLGEKIVIEQDRQGNWQVIHL